MDTNERRYIGLHFEPRFYGERGDGAHVLPASALVQALEGLQRLVHLIAMMHLGREIRARARVTQEIERTFKLFCETSRPGSFHQGTFISDGRAYQAGELQRSLFESEIHDDVADKTFDVFRSIQSGDEDYFRRIVADSAYRRPILSSIDKVFSNKSGVYLSIERVDKTLVLDQRRAEEYFEKVALQKDLTSDTVNVVTGYLTKVDFSERKLSLRLPDSQRVIPCTYDESAESVILSAPRELIQVAGTIELDAYGTPIKITGVEDVFSVNDDDIDLVDLLPEYLKSKSSNEMQVSVKLSDDKQVYSATYEPLDIEIVALTRKDLVSALEDELEFLWEEFANEEDDLLAPSGKDIKKKLNDIFVEVKDK